MAFPPGFLDDIRTRISLSALVGRRVALKQRARDDWWGLSPFTNEKSPSFHVREDKGFFHCFSTGEHGDHFTWLMKTEGVSFPEAVERLAEDAGLQMPERTVEQRKADEKRGELIDVVEAACQFFQKSLRSPAGGAAQEYLAGRGLRDDTIAAFRLGYAPADEQALRKHLKTAGYLDQELIDAGLIRRPDDGRDAYGFFRDRIMFPISDRTGRVIAFGGRFMGDAKAAGVGKYINSPDTPLFDKGRTLYNYREARAAAYDGAPLLVVEGYMDVIALAENGFEGAVAPLGTAITETQIETLWKAGDEPVMCMDGDAAGRKAALRAGERALRLLKPGKSLRFAFMPAGEDPDTMVRSHGRDALNKLIDGAQPLDQVLWESQLAQHDVDTPERRAALKKRLDGLAFDIEDKTVQTLYLSSFKDRMWDLGKTRQKSSKALWKSGPAGRGGGRGGELRAPMTAKLQQNRLTGDRRRQQALIATLVNHPELIPDYLETVDHIALDTDLDKLWRALQNVASSALDLDVATVHHHFVNTGQENLLKPVRDPGIFALQKAARPESDLGDARALIDHLLALWNQNTLQREVAKAARGADGETGEARVLAFRDSFVEGEDSLFTPDEDIF